MPFDAEIGQKSRDLIVLERARERVARAWGRGACAPVGVHCIVDAIDPRTIDEARHYEKVEPYLRLMGFRSSEEAWRWNDRDGRTQAEVLARFDAAIERLSTLSTGG